MANRYAEEVVIVNPSALIRWSGSAAIIGGLPFISDRSSLPLVLFHLVILVTCDSVV